jgi:SAM-dependent methyltransferase
MTDIVRPGDRPSERRAAARGSVVWDVVRPLVDGPAAGEAGVDVLDIGGGTGGFAVRVASLGARVTVVDPSPDALAALGRRAREEHVQVSAQQGDLATLLDAVGPRSADVVLCHGVLEVVDDPAAALATLRQVLRPGGALSLLVAQRHAAVVARAMAGHFGQARALLDAGPGDRDGRAGHRFTAAEATRLLEEAGFAVESVHGVRVFADLVPGSLLDLEPGATTALVDLERAVSERAEYLPLAAQLHVLARPGHG